MSSKVKAKADLLNIAAKCKESSPQHSRLQSHLSLLKVKQNVLVSWKSLIWRTKADTETIAHSFQNSCESGTAVGLPAFTCIVNHKRPCADTISSSHPSMQGSGMSSLRCSSRLCPAIQKSSTQYTRNTEAIHHPC